MKKFLNLLFLLLSSLFASAQSKYDCQDSKLMSFDSIVHERQDTIWIEYIQVRSKMTFKVKEKPIIEVAKQDSTSIVKVESKEDCIIPERVEWKLTTSHVERPMRHRIQFLSVQHDRTLNIPFEYYVEKTDCLRRYFYKKEYPNLQSALKDLSAIRKHYPDAFPVSY